MQQLSTVADIEAIIGRPVDAVMRKQIDALDDGCRRVLAAAPLAGLGYRDAEGRQRTTVAGGRAGFAEVESPRRISLPLPAGEPEPVAGGGVSFVFLLPGVREVLRINGTGTVAAGRLVVAVEQAYVHCARAVGRSGLWAAPRPAPAGGARAGDGPLADPRVAAFLAATPFLVVSSQDAGGDSDSSPRGDNPGFLKVLDGRTLVVPDRRGNKRADTFHNLLTDDRLSLVALVPGRLEVLRLSGTARLTDDPELLATMAVGAQVPHAAMVLTVVEATVAPSVAVESAQVWDRTRHVDLDAVPDLNALAAVHLASNMSRGWKGRLVRLIARGLSRYPRLTRPLMGSMFSKQLLSEGYGESPPVPPAPGRAVRVAEVVRETAEATTLVLEDVEGSVFDFLPGQFFTLVLDIGGRTVRRAYSASSAPGSTRVTLTIKRTTDGYASAHVRDVVRPGDDLRILGPSGSFHVDRPYRELVLLAAGSGITPMMSIIRSVLAGAQDTRITLLYGNRTEAGIIFSAALADLARAHPTRLSVHHVLSRPGPQWGGRRGRLDPETVGGVLAELAPGAGAHFYSCGPAGMLAGVNAVLDEIGVPAERRHEETFGSLPARAGAGVEQKMTVGDLGTVTVAAGQTLLDAGLEAALPLPYSCTVGSCGECRIRLRAGEVTMAEPNCLSRADRDRGFILACVAQPRTEVVVELDSPKAGSGGPGAR
ncbi:2Fe-2S iron-sulfur cluster-binding protein [Actinoplanes sp. NPDC051494]|uniref:2Fe-2S iron-sulfur cluster-binding protein n=1 Tax=Actinoplanes sp. NPDC051494 TaxID=3363907 RepID=UPI0037886242